MSPEGWLLLSTDEFETFCDEVSPRLTYTSKSTKISGSRSMTASGVINANITDFDQGLKQDPKPYVEFHGQTSKYFRVSPQWLATARVNCVDYIFELNFVVPTIGKMFHSLFKRQCAYVTSVFNTVNKAGQARSIVQPNSITVNAHDVLLEL
jgi:hypothetical protein